MTLSPARADAAPRRRARAPLVSAVAPRPMPDGGVPEPIAASLRIVCDALRASPDEVTSIGLESHLPLDFIITALVAYADALADDYGLRTHMTVHEGRLDIRFERRPLTR